MLDGLLYARSNSIIDRYFTLRIIFFLFKNLYIAFVNFRFLGKPSSEILSFLLSAHQEAYQREMAFFEKCFYSLFGGQLIQVLDYDGSRIGFALYRIDPIWHIHLYKFGIIKPYRGKGLAKAFLLKTFQYYHQKGFKSVSLYSESQYAARIYQPIGFEPVHERGKLTYMVKQL